MLRSDDRSNESDYDWWENSEDESQTLEKFDPSDGLPTFCVIC